jgi:glycosyltransferase involved in cell wall biosynthesis
LRAYVSSPIHTIPNGVDLEYFSPGRAAGELLHRSRLIFTGNMSYKPNIDAVQHFVRDVLPLVRRSLPEVELHIVGMDPTPAVRRLADGARVVVTGRVDDVRPHFDAATVAVAPLRIARGLQNKVLEAMAMRVPVVASPGAFQGISAVADEDLLVAGEPEGFARAVLSLLQDPARRERYAAAGRACVQRNHSWDESLQRLERLVVGGVPQAAADGTGGAGVSPR